MPRYQAILCLLFALAFLAPMPLQAQVVRGFISDAEDGEPLEGTTVVLMRGNDLVAGSTTDRDGFYTLSRFPAGRYVLIATFIGFETVRDTVRIGSDAILLRNLAMEPATSELDEVIVRDERASSAARVEAGRVSARPADIAAVPSPDVSGDLAGYLSTLPGLVTVGDRGGQLFVRGGEPWQNLVLLDGMWVYQPFHVLGFFSAFPTDILSKVDIYAGGYGSAFGGRISSVIDVQSRNGNKRSYAGSASIAPFVATAYLEGPVVDDRLSFILSARESVIASGAAMLVDDPLPFEFGDFFAKLHGTVSGNSQMSVTALRTHDSGEVGNAIGAAGGRPDRVSWENQAYGMRYLVLPNAFPVLAEFLISYSKFDSKLGPGSQPIRSSRLGSINTSANVSHFVDKTTVQWGLFARSLELESKLGGAFQNVELRREFLTEVGLYLEPRIKLGESFEGSAGVRLHAFPSKNRTFFEPRVRASYATGPHRLNFASGVYHQEVVGLSDRRDAASVFTAWAAVPFPQVPRSIHVIAGYGLVTGKGFDLAIETYRKWLDGLFVPEWTAFPRFTTRLQSADGDAWGVDIRVEWRRPRYLVSATYGLSSVRYTATQETLALWYGQARVEYRPAHDRRHQLNVLGTADMGAFSLSARWQLGSGLPFSRALGFDGFVLMDGAVDPFEEPGARRVIYEAPFNGILPDYHRLDVSLERVFPFRGGSLTAQAGVINVYDRRNLFYLDTFTLTRVDQLPVIPTFGLKYAFGE